MNTARNQLRQFVERAERLIEEKDAILQDLRELYAEAKGNGFDVKALRTIIKMRKQDAEERREQEAIVETYAHALGMLATTELGQAALARRHAELEQQGREIMDGLERTGSKTLGEEAEKVTEKVKRVSVAANGKRAETLVNPKTLPSDKSIKDIADRAEERSRQQPNPPDDDGGIPPGLKRNPDNSLPTTA